MEISTAAAPAVYGLTSGASGRIIPLFHRALLSLLRFLVVFRTAFLWLLRRRPDPSAPPSPRPRKGGWRRRSGRGEEEEEDARRRRALAEGLEMGGRDRFFRSESFLFSGRRGSLFCRSWLPVAGDTKGILVIIHGLNEHSGRYAYFAKQLTSCNFGVYAMDWIGHGGSDGLHGYVPSLDCVVADTGLFLEKIKSENPGIPCFLFGHSTGGAVVLKAALHPHIEAMLEGVVLTSPALRVKPAHPIVGLRICGFSLPFGAGTSDSEEVRDKFLTFGDIQTGCLNSRGPENQAVAPLFSLVLPKFQFKGANKRGIPVSRDPAAMLAKYSDPLVYTGPIRVRTGHEILRISSFLIQNLRAVTIPFLVLHGTADRVTDPLASQDLYNVAASSYKDIKLYEGFLHDLLFEPERDEIGADIIDWMERKLQHSCLM